VHVHTVTVLLQIHDRLHFEFFFHIFFVAIQFVLSEEFLHLKKDVQQSLMFYDSKRQVVVASVEIIFDNTDRRLPVSLRHSVIKVLILDYMQRTVVYCQSVL